MRNTWPSPAEEEMADIITIDEWLIQDKESSFMLKMSDDAMAEAGILKGDVILLARGMTPQNGDIVVAQVDDAWAVRFLDRRPPVSLVPANRTHRPIVPQEELRIAGVVIAVIRKYH